MKRLIILFTVLFCSFFSANAQTDTTWASISICKGETYDWYAYHTTQTSINVIYHDGIYDTIVGSPIELSPDSTTKYVLISINGNQPAITRVYGLVLTVNTPPTFTVDSIHHVTCPDPYPGPGTDTNVGPWADGGFSLTLASQLADCEWINVSGPNTWAYLDLNAPLSIGGKRAGTYSITAHSTNGCEVSQQVTIQQPPAWEYDNATIIWDDTITCSNTEGIIKFECPGGSLPLTWDWQPNYHWDPDDPSIWFGDSIMPYPNSSTISVEAPGQYFLRPIDSHGCRLGNLDYIGPFTIYQILPDTVHLAYYTPGDSATLIECPESIEVCTDAPFFNALSLGHGSYSWSTGDTTQNFI